MRKVAGLDAHSTYVVVTIVSNDGEVLAGPKRIANEEADRLEALLADHAPLEVVVEASGEVQRPSLQMPPTPQPRRSLLDPLTRAIAVVCALDRGRFIGAGAT